MVVMGMMVMDPVHTRRGMQFFGRRVKDDSGPTVWMDTCAYSNM
jgi:hypothetical protein